MTLVASVSKYSIAAILPHIHCSQWLTLGVNNCFFLQLLQFCEDNCYTLSDSVYMPDTSFTFHSDAHSSIIFALISVRVNPGIIAHVGRDITQLTLVVTLVAIWVRNCSVETFHDNATIEYVRCRWRNIKQLRRHIPVNYVHDIRSVSRMYRYISMTLLPNIAHCLGHSDGEEFL